MTTLYGISNCDTVRKARQWLDAKQIEYDFHDFRKDGINSAQVERWLQQVGWEKLVNRRSTTWKSLPEQDRQALASSAATDLILQHPTLIKRPLLEHAGEFKVGFKTATYETIFG